MSRYWSRIARSVEPYVPGEQPRENVLIKLNTNENPYPPSPRVIEAIRQAADWTLRLYPDPTCLVLRSAVAAHFGLTPEEVFVGNGSDEILAFAFQAFFDPGRTILFPDITYSFYPVYAALYGLDYRQVPLRQDFTLDLPAFRGGNGGIVLANPNAPTGLALPAADVLEIAAANPEAVILVDEAYAEFGAESVAPWLKDHPNLLVIHTLSKDRALAGLRASYALGGRELIAGLERIKNSFNSYTMDRLALAGATAAVEDGEYYREINSRVAATRERFKKDLAALGFRVLDSKANFVFASHPRRSGEELFQGLRARGILVRHFKKPARIADWLRISIGTDEQMERAAGVLGELVSG